MVVARGAPRRGPGFRATHVVPLERLRRDVAAEPPLTAEDMAALAERPRARTDCVDGPRPCPWLACRYHLLSDVTPHGSLLLHADPSEVGADTPTCALDVADARPHTIAEVATLIGVTRERARQSLLHALVKLHALAPDAD